MLQHLHVSMAELSMEVGLTADAVSSASLLRKAGYSSILDHIQVALGPNLQNSALEMIDGSKYLELDEPNRRQENTGCESTVSKGC